MVSHTLGDLLMDKMKEKIVETTESKKTETKRTPREVVRPMAGDVWLDMDHRIKNEALREFTIVSIDHEKQRARVKRASGAGHRNIKLSRLNTRKYKFKQRGS